MTRMIEARAGGRVTVVTQSPLGNRGQSGQTPWRRTVLKVCVLTDQTEDLSELTAALAGEDFACATLSSLEGIAELAPDLVLLDADSNIGASVLSEMPPQNIRVPTIVAGHLERICGLDSYLWAADFLVKPYDLRELVLRVKRLVHTKGTAHSTELISRGDLVIDTGRCEVTVAGRPVVLTFREYELLKFLAGSPGRVFTRDVLLDRVWGHDYFGGDRTVDVHIRRLRAKIEAFGHSFIETVRSVGYRFTQTLER